MTLQPSIYDKATDRLLDLNAKVKAKLHRDFRRTKPYRGEEVTPDEELYAYNQLTEDEMFRLIQRHGDEAVNAMVMRMETMMCTTTILLWMLRTMLMIPERTGQV